MKEERVPMGWYRVPFILCRELPQDGRWTAEKRQHWLDTMISSVDYLVEVVEPMAALQPHQAKPSEAEGGK